MNKKQIELAKEMIKNLQDYIEIQKLLPKLKLADMNAELGFIVDFIEKNVRKL